MLTRRVGLTLRERVVAGLGEHAAHAAPMMALGVATLIGAVAAFAFQVISARAVGPVDFGQLAAFLALLNVAAVASSALQNAVAVASAGLAGTGLPAEPPGRRYWVSEATIVGIGGAVVLAASTPLLVGALATTPAIVLLAAAAIPITFWVAQALGILQGSGRAAATVWWTTGSLLIRVALVLLSLALGLGIVGVLTAVLVSMTVPIIGTWGSNRRLPRARRAVFSSSGASVLLLSLLSAWLVNNDIIVVRATADEVIAGSFASAAILVKAAFALPAALSIYMLPRFVRNQENEEMLRVGQRGTVAVAAAAGVAFAAVFGLFGGPIARVVFGDAYTDSGGLLLPLALAYLPWVIAQSVLIRLTAQASRPAVIVLVVAAGAQLVGFAVAAPNIAALVSVQAVLGAGLLVALLLIARHRPPVGRSSVT